MLCLNFKSKNLYTFSNCSSTNCSIYVRFTTTDLTVYKSVSNSVNFDSEGSKKNLFIVDSGGHNNEFCMNTHVSVNSLFDDTLIDSSPVLVSINTCFKMLDSTIKSNDNTISCIKPIMLSDAIGDYQLINHFNLNVNTLDSRLKFINMIKSAYNSRDCSSIIDANNYLINQIILYSKHYEILFPEFSLLNLLKDCYSGTTLTNISYFRIINLVSLNSMSIYHGSNISCGEMVNNLLIRYHNEITYTAVIVPWHIRLVSYINPYLSDLKNIVNLNIPDLTYAGQIVLYAPPAALLIGVVIYNRTIVKTLISNFGYTALAPIIGTGISTSISNVGHNDITPTFHDKVVDSIVEFLSNSFSG